MPRGRPKGSKNKPRVAPAPKEVRIKKFRCDVMYEKVSEAIWHNHHVGPFGEHQLESLFPTKHADRMFERFKQRLKQLGVPHKVVNLEGSSRVGVVILLDADEFEERFGGSKR